MKKQSNNLVNTIGLLQLENIANGSNETLDTGFNQLNNKVFTTADLWNIQRKGTSSMQRRHSL